MSDRTAGLLEPSQTYGGGGGGGTIGGSIASPQVAFGTAANTIGGSNFLTWDNANKNLGVGGSSATSTLHDFGSVNFSKVVSTAVNYTALASDYQIDCNPVPPAAITITLPSSGAAGIGYGKRFMISDVVGGAAVGTPITIAAAGGETIDGAATFVINVAWSSIEIRSQGGTNGWKVI